MIQDNDTTTLKWLTLLLYFTVLFNFLYSITFQATFIFRGWEMDTETAICNVSAFLFSIALAFFLRTQHYRRFIERMVSRAEKLSRGLFVMYPFLLMWLGLRLTFLTDISFPVMRLSFYIRRLAELSFVFVFLSLVILWHRELFQVARRNSGKEM